MRNLLLCILCSCTFLELKAYENIVVGNINYTVDIVNGQNVAALSSGKDCVGDVIVPGTIDYQGKTYIVNAIMRDAFIDNILITSMILPNSVETIGSQCFMGCINLERIELPQALQQIGSSCFIGCTKLNSIVIPNTLSTLPSYSFYGCKGLITAKLSTNLSEIGYGCFYGCSSLKSIAIPNSVHTMGQMCFKPIVSKRV